MSSQSRTEGLLIGLRRIARVIDQHSARLDRQYGMTAPQALLLRKLQGGERRLSGELARSVQLSAATVTDMLNRLEQRGLVQRERDAQDRRRVWVALTAAGQACMAQVPPLLQDVFARRFEALEDSRQEALLAAVEEIGRMMGAETLDASPVLVSGDILAPPEA